MKRNKKKERNGCYKLKRRHGKKTTVFSNVYLLL